VNGLGFTEHGGLERVGIIEVPDPAPGPREVRLRVRAAGFNRLDRFVLAGIPGVRIDRPHILGSDASGIVDSVGSEVRDLVAGARVLVNPGLWDGTCPACRSGDEALCREFRIVGEHTQGSAAPLLVVPRRNVYPLPERLSFEEGAAAPLVFLTAWRALSSIGMLRPGESCAIIGAGGGVSTAAVQVAKRLGARVVVASRSQAKADRCRALGADDALAFTEERPLDRVLWEWSEKRGVDVVFDSVGQPTVGRSLRALARGGRLVVIGATAGPLAEVDLRTIFWRQASIRGSSMAGRGEFEAALAGLSDGSLRPVIDSRYPLHQGREALQRLDAPDLFGKVVVRLEDA
jgi:NADPH:quinone reductase-like Zn-dependent oxidoreductase